MKPGKVLVLAGLCAAAPALPSCVKLTHEVQQSKPLEINVNVRLIDDKLDEFFAYQNRAASTQPATQPAAG